MLSFGKLPTPAYSLIVRGADDDDDLFGDRELLDTYTAADSDRRETSNAPASSRSLAVVGGRVLSASVAAANDRSGTALRQDGCSTEAAA